MLSAKLLGRLLLHVGADDRNGLAYLLLLRDLLWGHLLPPAEVDAQALARDIAPPLVHFAPQDHLQGLQEQVMSRVVFNRLLRMVSESSRKLLRGSRARERLMLCKHLLQAFKIHWDLLLFCNFFRQFNRESISSKRSKRVLSR